MSHIIAPGTSLTAQDVADLIDHALLQAWILLRSGRDLTASHRSHWTSLAVVA